MTAINVFVARDCTHLWTDTGHYDPVTRRLAYLAPKIRAFPRLGAVLAWSGPSAAVDGVAAAIDASGFRSFEEAVSRIPDLVRSLRVMGRYSAIFLNAAGGVAVEENSRTHHLSTGSFVKSISSPLPLDLDDLDGSAVRLMEQQRASSGLVFGQCRHYRISPRGMEERILRDWGDRPLGLVLPGATAAKIQDLTVDTLNVKHAAITGSVTSDTQIIVPNTYGHPVTVVAWATGTYSGNHSSSQGWIELEITRASDGKVVASGYSQVRSGVAAGSLQSSIGGYDGDAPAGNVTYTLTATPRYTSSQPASGSVAISAKEIDGLYSKR